MNSLRYFLIFCIYLFCGSQINGQNTEIDSLSQAFKAADNDTSRIDILNGLAFSYVHVDPSAAKDDVDITIRSAREIDYKIGEAEALNVLGGIEWSLGSYEKSLSFYLQSLKKYRLLGDELASAKILNNIGEIYKKLGDKTKSLNYLLQATRILEKYDNATLGYYNLGEIHYMLSNYDSAKYYYRRALDANISQNTQHEAYAHHGLAEIQLVQRNFEKALKSANTALNIRAKGKDHRGTSYSLLLLGNIYHQRGIKDSANYFINRAEVLADKIGARDIILNVYKNKSQIFAENQMYDSAYFYHLLYAQIKDDLFNEEKSNQIAKMQTIFETELLKKEFETSASKLKQQNTIIIAIIMLLILSAAVAGAFYKQRKVQQGVNDLLASKNHKIQAQSEEIQAQAEKLQKLNKNLESLNATLENQVKSRTQLLKDQNKLLAAYAFTNAHELRAPVASVMGLVDLLQRSDLPDNEKEIVEHLVKSTGELDIVIRNIRKKLESKGGLLLDEE